jgi:hypothetical protein
MEINGQKGETLALNQKNSEPTDSNFDPDTEFRNLPIETPWTLWKDRIIYQETNPRCSPKLLQRIRKVGLRCNLIYFRPSIRFLKSIFLNFPLILLLVVPLKVQKVPMDQFQFLYFQEF